MPSMRRRDLLIRGSALAGAAAWLSGCTTSSPTASATTGAVDFTLVDRVTWGADMATMQRWQHRSRREFLADQLHPPRDTVLPPLAQARIDAMTIVQTPMPTLVVAMDRRRREADAAATEDARKEARQAWQQEMNRLAKEAASRSLLRAIHAPDQLREQLVWFWFNHFNVHQAKADLRAMVGDYEDRLRMHALGRFRDLLIASATHPAMIRYLDNAQNAARRINENYARELMELHTLGVDGGYAQRDVQELARVLTGLGVVRLEDAPPTAPRASAQAPYRDGLMEFNPARHDAGEKRLLGRTVAAGQGFSEIIDTLTRLAAEPATARHICSKLALYFAHDTPPTALVDRMVRAFGASDGEIAATLQAMFDAPEFTPSLGRKFKDPVHYVVSAVRLVANGRDGVDTEPMIAWLNRLGEGLYNRQTPDGYPLDDRAWSGSGQMTARFEIARAIGAGRAKLFGPDEPTSPVARLDNALYRDAIFPTLAQATRAALDAAASPQEWNAVLLSSPEFMYR